MTVVEIYKKTTCTTDTKVYNDTCEVSCTLGYHLTRSDSVHKCTENGSWSNDVTCESTLRQQLFGLFFIGRNVYLREPKPT